MSFVVDLWESVFTPGITPSLIIATHGSFAALISTLLVLVVTTKNIHFFALLCLSLCLWASITWFISELKAIEREKENKKETEKTETAASSGVQVTKTDDSTLAPRAVSKPKPESL